MRSRNRKCDHKQTSKNISDFLPNQSQKNQGSFRPFYPVPRSHVCDLFVAAQNQRKMRRSKRYEKTSQTAVLRGFSLELLSRFELETSSLPTLPALFYFVATYQNLSQKAQHSCGFARFPYCILLFSVISFCMGLFDTRMGFVWVSTGLISPRKISCVSAVYYQQATRLYTQTQSVRGYPPTPLFL